MENELVNLNDSPFGIVPDEPQESSVPVVDIGFSDEKLDEAIDYMEGKTQSLDFLEKFKADNNSKIKDYALISTVTQLARIPSLIKYLNNVYSYLYASSSLSEMDSKDLVTLGRNLSSEISSIMESSRKTIDTIERSSGISSEYKDLLDSLLSQSPDDLKHMKEFLDSRKKGSETSKDDYESKDTNEPSESEESKDSED